MMSDPSEMIRHDRHAVPEVAAGDRSSTSGRTMLLVALVAVAVAVLLVAL